MNQFFFQLGSFSALSMAEISAVLPQFSFAFHEQANIVQGEFKSSQTPFTNTQILKEAVQQKFDELGGSIRCGIILGNTQENFLQIATDLLEKKYQKYKKKIRFGISLFTNARSFQRKKMRKNLILQLKKACKSRDISVRFVNRDFRNLDAGTYFKEQLSKEENTEFFLWEEQGEFWYGETLAAQNIHDFAERDYKKPVRDMQVGMLPPKLALMMVNFARDLKKGTTPETLWDPFCGTGTVLVEAQRLGISVFGSDKYKKMVEATAANMKHFFPDFLQDHIFQYDVMKKPDTDLSVEAIVSEGYLGAICTQPLSEKEFREREDEVGAIYAGFFENVAPQAKKIVIAFPFWRKKGSGYFFSQKLLETAKTFGYTPQAFAQGTERGSVRFIRKEQVVGREVFCFVASKK